MGFESTLVLNFSGFVLPYSGGTVPGFHRVLSSAERFCFEETLGKKAFQGTKTMSCANIRKEFSAVIIGKRKPELSA